MNSYGSGADEEEKSDDADAAVLSCCHFIISEIITVQQLALFVRPHTELPDVYPLRIQMMMLDWLTCWFSVISVKHCWSFLEDTTWGSFNAAAELSFQVCMIYSFYSTVF